MAKKNTKGAIPAVPPKKVSELEPVPEVVVEETVEAEAEAPPVDAAPETPDAEAPAPEETAEPVADEPPDTQPETASEEPATPEGVSLLMLEPDDLVPTVLGMPSAVAKVYDAVRSGNVIVARWTTINTRHIAASLTGDELASVYLVDERECRYGCRVGGTVMPEAKPLEDAKTWATSVLVARGVGFV